MSCSKRKKSFALHIKRPSFLRSVITETPWWNKMDYKSLLQHTSFRPYVTKQVPFNSSRIRNMFVMYWRTSIVISISSEEFDSRNFIILELIFYSLFCDLICFSFVLIIIFRSKQKEFCVGYIHFRRGLLTYLCFTNDLNVSQKLFSNRGRIGWFMDEWLFSKSLKTI